MGETITINAAASATTTSAGAAMTDMQYRERQQREVDDNYAAFKEMLDDLVYGNLGRFALMRERKVVGIFETSRDAYAAAHERFPDRIFSIQEITRKVIYLGARYAY